MGEFLNFHGVLVYISLVARHRPATPTQVTIQYPPSVSSRPDHTHISLAILMEPFSLYLLYTVLAFGKDQAMSAYVSVYLMFWAI